MQRQGQSPESEIPKVSEIQAVAMAPRCSSLVWGGWGAKGEASVLNTPCLGLFPERPPTHSPRLQLVLTSRAIQKVFT